MLKINRIAACAVVAGLAALWATGCAPTPQTEKTPAASTADRSAGILGAEWSVVEKGSYSAPMGKLAEAPASEWTATTVGAGIDGKPREGEVKTLVGEIIDVSCYLQLGKHGEKHRSCGQNCLRNGQPMGLVTEDGSIYLLMEEEHDPRRDSQTTLREAAIEHMAQIMEVSGTLAEHNGHRALFVQGFLKR